MKTRLPLLLVLTLGLSRLAWPAADQKGAEKLLRQPSAARLTAAQALTEALAGPDGEYAARAEYAVIINKFGDVQPFATIVQAEQRHIEALKRHFEMRGLAVPADDYPGKVAAPATLAEAAASGVKAEERNVAMYERLLAATRDQRDLQTVFTHLQWASREHHLPAFKAAVDNRGWRAGGFTCGAASGPGRGGPPPWAGCQRGGGKGGCGGGGGCGLGWGPPAADSAMPGPGRWHRWGQRGAGTGN